MAAEALRAVTGYRLAAPYPMDTSGKVAFRALWSNDRERVLARALEKVIAGRPLVSERRGGLVPMMRGLARMDEMLQRSGPSARRDLPRQAPPMYAMARIAGLAGRKEHTHA